MELAIYLLGIMSGIFATVAATNAFQLRQGKGAPWKSTSGRPQGYPFRTPRARRRAAVLCTRVRRKAAVPCTPGAARACACRAARGRRTRVRRRRWRSGVILNYLIWLTLMSCVALLQ